MSTTEFLNWVHEFRTIIWFFVVLGVFALVGGIIWFSSTHHTSDEKASPSDDLYPKDQWGD